MHCTGTVRRPDQQPTVLASSCVSIRAASGLTRLCRGRHPAWLKLGPPEREWRALPGIATVVQLYGERGGCEESCLQLRIPLGARDRVRQVFQVGAANSCLTVTITRTACC